MRLGVLATVLQYPGGSLPCRGLRLLPNQDSGREIALAPGESRRISPTTIAVTSKGVIHDSRCPETSIVSGRAVQSSKSASADGMPSRTYTLHTNAGSPAEILHDTLLVRLTAVTPEHPADADTLPRGFSGDLLH